MDFRFPMLVIYLKYIIGKYNIKNTEEDKSYINSFAWTNILLTFLQDILEPPLFPRLLIEDNQKNINIKVGGGIGKEKKKTLEDEFISQNIRKFNVIKDIKYLKTIENNFYKKEKNIFKMQKDYLKNLELKSILKVKDKIEKIIIIQNKYLLVKSFTPLFS
jgi:hypothetical protein